MVDMALIKHGAPPLATFSMGVVLAVPSATVTIRRLHDVGRSGIWMLLPSVGISLTIWLAWRSLATGARFPVPTEETWTIITLGTTLSISFQTLVTIWLSMRSNEGPNRFGHGLTSAYRAKPLARVSRENVQESP